MIQKNDVSLFQHMTCDLSYDHLMAAALQDIMTESILNSQHHAIYRNRNHLACFFILCYIYNMCVMSSQECILEILEYTIKWLYQVLPTRFCIKCLRSNNTFPKHYNASCLRGKSTLNQTFVLYLAHICNWTICH